MPQPSITTTPDTGFPGIAKHHPNSRQPRKRGKKRPLSREDKLFNRSIPRRRILERASHRLAQALQNYCRPIPKSPSPFWFTLQPHRRDIQPRTEQSGFRKKYGIWSKSPFGCGGDSHMAVLRVIYENGNELRRSQSPFGCGGDSHTFELSPSLPKTQVVSIAFRLWGRFPRKMLSCREIAGAESQSPFGCGGDSHTWTPAPTI